MSFGRKRNWNKFRVLGIKANSQSILRNPNLINSEEKIALSQITFLCNKILSHWESSSKALKALKALKAINLKRLN